MIIKLTNLQNGLSAEFISTWTLPFIACDSVHKLTATDNLNMKFEMDKIPRGFDSQVNPTTTVVKIFNTNKQLQTSNAYYDRMLTVSFLNLNTITPNSTVAEQLAQLFTSNDRDVYLQIMDDIGNEYICTCAIIETPKSVYHDSFKLQMLSNSFSKISQGETINYNEFKDINGNVIPLSDRTWKFENGTSVEMGVNSSFTRNYNNIFSITETMRLTFNNNNSGTLKSIILRETDKISVKVEMDLTNAGISGNDNVILDFKEKILKVNIYEDYSNRVVFPDLVIGAKYEIEFMYTDNSAPNPTYYIENIENVLTIPHLMLPFDEGE